MRKNDCYSIACNDLEFLYCGMKHTYFNQVILQCYNCVCRLLKSVLEVKCMDMSQIDSSEEISDLYAAICAQGTQLGLQLHGLLEFQDLVKRVAGQGAGFIWAKKEDRDGSLKIVLEVFNAVNAFRDDLGLYCNQKVCRLQFLRSNKVF